MILHVAGLDKFIPPFVKLVREEFKEERHYFWLLSSVNDHPVDEGPDIYISGKGFFAKFRAYVKLILKLHIADKVLLHGLFNPRLVFILALCPWLLAKCYWVIWGNDLYQYKSASRTGLSRIKEALRRIVIPKIGHLVTYIEGDVRLARKWYGARGVHHECLMYLSNVVNPDVIAAPAMGSGQSGVRILLGNSAHPSNNHIEALEGLLPYKNQDVKIFVPLSYGDPTHARKVISFGRRCFGEKFVPLTEFMAFDQYVDFLKTLDVAIFNHQRQQAMGNTITLLGMGKTVFMRDDVSQWEFLRGLGITLHDVARLSLRLPEPELAQQNARIVQAYFSRETLKRQLSDIFGE